MLTNLLPAGATHTTIDLFEQQPLLTSFEVFFFKKLDHYIPRTVRCMSLMFCVTGTI